MATFMGKGLKENEEKIGRKKGEENPGDHSLSEAQWLLRHGMFLKAMWHHFDFRGLMKG